MKCKTHSCIKPRGGYEFHEKIKKEFTQDSVANYRQLAAIGIGLDKAPIMAREHKKALEAIGMDALSTNPSIPTDINYLRTFLPGLVYVITQPRDADTLLGVTTVGNWEDESIVQGMIEPTGDVNLYGDYSDVPFSSWNPATEERDIVRFESGLEVGHLEELRTNKAGYNSVNEKRAAVSLALELKRDEIAFYGYNNGTNRTYGMLNEPSLSPYLTLPSGGNWETKSFADIQGDIIYILNALQTQSAGVIKVMGEGASQITLVLPNNRINYLSATDSGKSLRQWLQETYPNVRVTSTSRLDEANGGANVMYAYAEEVNDGASTDNQRTFDQLVVNRLYALGNESRLKTYVEAYSNALSGTLAKRPYAIARATGL